MELKWNWLLSQFQNASIELEIPSINGNVLFQGQMVELLIVIKKPTTSPISNEEFEVN